LTVEPETDGTLIQRSARGRPDAFVEVVRRHEVAVHGFLARRAGRQVAADLLGEVWVRAFAGRDGYDPAYADARPWLFGIARNVLRAHWRARQDANPAADRAEDPWAAIAALPPAERDVLLLVAWEQLTPAQAALALGVPPGTARSRLHRARAALRLVLAEEKA
jgi:RNA polymerase sigma-70 factor (ECF subfamily)